jgi:hypothetical protein
MTQIIFGEEYMSWSSSLCNFLPVSYHFVPLRPKYLPQCPILKHPQPMTFPSCEYCAQGIPKNHYISNSI